MTTTSEAECAGGSADAIGRTAPARRAPVTPPRSIARGEAAPYSDIDLLAEIDRTTVAPFSLVDLAGLKLDLAHPLGPKVQIATVLDRLHPLVRAAMEARAIEALDNA